MTQSFIVGTDCCQKPVACVTWGLCAGNWWPLGRCNALNDDACVGDWSSTSCSLGPPSLFFSRLLPTQGSCCFSS